MHTTGTLTTITKQSKKASGYTISRETEEQKYGHVEAFPTDIPESKLLSASSADLNSRCAFCGTLLADAGLKCFCITIAFSWSNTHRHDAMQL